MRHNNMHIFGTHYRMNSGYPELIEARELQNEWNDLVDASGISTADFEAAESFIQSDVIGRLSAYKMTGDVDVLDEIVLLVSPYVGIAQESEEELVGPPVEAAGSVPPEFQNLKDSWEQLEAAGITTSDFNGFDQLTKNSILESAMVFEQSGLSDFGALQDMLTLANNAKSSQSVVESDSSSDEPSMSAEDIIVAAFAQEFPMQDVREHTVFEPMKLAVEYAQKFHKGTSIEDVAKGIRIFKFAGLPFYIPETLLKFVVLCIERSIDYENTVLNLVSIPEYCLDPARLDMVRVLFGDLAANRFEDFCNLTKEEKADELFLSDYNFASLLGINEFGFDEMLLSQMGTVLKKPLATEDLKPIVKEVVDTTIKEAKSKEPTSKLVARTASNTGKVSVLNADTVHPLLRWGTLSVAVIGLGLLFNKIRKL